ncbi:hypothetical protein CLU79DRAFT_750888 [Phycomyces nitens]|nr:hypothetical protein CLU79DRAFT_750888 [Phycomyces nitens]
MASYSANNDLEGAFNLVVSLRTDNLDSNQAYQTLVDMLISSPPDHSKIPTVLNWFSQSARSKRKRIPEDIELWCKLMNLGFSLKNSTAEGSLRGFISAFETTFDTKSMNHTAWTTMIKAYGITYKSLKVSECLKEINNSPEILQSVDVKEIVEYATTAYANCQQYDLVEKNFKFFGDANPPSEKFLKDLTLTSAFHGNIKETEKYADLCEQLYPSADVRSMRLLSYQRDILVEHKSRVNYQGIHGKSLTMNHKKADDWIKLVETILEDDKKPLDIVGCNNIVGYLATANSLDYAKFPMKKAQEFVDTYMPKHGVEPNSVTYSFLMVGYARTQEYKSENNARLDKALETLQVMLKKRFNVVNSYNFNALMKACIPHKYSSYSFDYFRLNSYLEPNQHDRHPKIFLDKRFFEIEKLMLEYNINYDRYTFMTAMTCLGGAGLYIALSNRWALTKKYGIKRDAALYQHYFSLAARNSDQARYALGSVKNELARDISPDKITKPLYMSLLECSVSAQNHEMSQQIIATLCKDFSLLTQDYNTLIKSSGFLDNGSSQLNDILKEMKEKNVKNDHHTWLSILCAKTLLKEDHSQIQKTFNDYSMYRFEKHGNVPIPIRKQDTTVPFPTGPYSNSDQQIINVYLSSLVDHQDLSLLFGILKTSHEQDLPIKLTQNTINSIHTLAQKEKSKDDLAWFVKETKWGKRVNQ